MIGQVVGRLQRAADGGAATAALRGRDQRLLDRRSLRRRRPLHGRLRCWLDMLSWALDDARLQRAAARSRSGRRALARAMWLERLEADAALRRAWLAPPAPRRVLEARLGVRGLRRHRLPGLHGRRLGGRRTRNAILRLLEGSRARARADRAVGARLPARRDARPGDRLPPGVHALVGSLAQGRGHRDHGRADAPRLDAGRGRAGDVPHCPPGPVGCRAGVADAGGRDAAAMPEPHRAAEAPELGRRAAGDGDRGVAAPTPGAGSDGGARPTIPATSGEDTLALSFDSAPLEPDSTSWACQRSPWISRPTSPGRSPPCACATLRAGTLGPDLRAS